MHCLTKGDGGILLQGHTDANAGWQQDSEAEVRFTGSKCDQEQIGNVRLRTGNEVRGPRSSDRADGGAVAPVFELISLFYCFPAHAPLARYRFGVAVRAVKYSRALREIEE